MIEPRNAVEHYNKETQKLAGKLQLQQYGHFLKLYHNRVKTFEKKLPNTQNTCSTLIHLENKPYEDVSLLELVQSDNKLLSRILVSLGAICEELIQLVNEAYENYVSLLFYGEVAEVGKAKANPGMISRLVEKLQKANFFINHVQNVIILLLKQLCAVLGSNLYIGNSATCFPEPLDCLGELLVCLIIMDNTCSGLLRDHWTVYRRTVKLMLHNHSQFNFPLGKIQCLDKCLAEIESKVLSGTILQQTLEKCLDNSVVVEMKNCSLANEFTLFIQQLLTELERDDESFLFTQIWLQANALFVFWYYLFGSLDKKLFKRLCEINKKTGACTISGNIVWYPEKFLIKHIPILSKTLDTKALTANRLTQITNRTQNLVRNSSMICAQAYTFINDVINLVKYDTTVLKVKYLNDACDILIDGMKLAKKISELIKWITNLHVNEMKPMAKSVLIVLCRLMETLKALQYTFHKNLLPLICITVLISQHLTHKALSLLINIKKSFTQEKSYKRQQLDVLSALNVAEHALKGPNTSKRILVAKLALSSSGLSQDKLTELRFVINRLEVICNIHSLLCKLCNCSFLYWHQVLLPVYFSKLVTSGINISRFYLLFDALNDCSSIVGERIIKKTFRRYLKSEMLDRLNQFVETNLRLQTHLHLQLSPCDPFQNSMPNTFKNLTAAGFSGDYIHIKEEVEHYLSTMFYNLTTVVLHDWKTYGEMRRLASLQYALNTVEDNLPMQTLEQGLDVLEIMRNIHLFVGKYMYNLNNQIFVEERSNAKHLNTINISHVANSIRTHGIGIMNTTVNFTYQFLQNKFYIFSQFMFDELIKSRLLKDLRFFMEQKDELNQMYPYDRAEKFNIGIRKLGLNAEGQSYLDLFRKLITQIGNAMGYVRMIRSGGRRCLAEATCFIPDFKAVGDINELLKDNCNKSSSLDKPMTCFQRDLNNLVDNFEEATEYFKLLVNAFAPVFRNPQNIHLKNFYIIIPPLTINFVEYLFVSKERLNKKDRSGAAFTDDGFAMGLAYIVELLEQTGRLNSLHWFQSIKVKHAMDRKNLEIQKAVASKEDSKLQQTLSLTEKRLNAFEKEFQLLYYSFNSARIFFQS